MFGAATPPIGTDPAALVVIDNQTEYLSVAQREFNRLTLRIRNQREKIGVWEQAEVEQRFAFQKDYLPVLRLEIEAKRRLLVQMDALLCQTGKKDRLTKTRFEALQRDLLGLVQSLLGAQPDPELEALFQRHSGLSTGEISEHNMDLTKAILGEIFGADAVRGLDANSPEEFADKMKQRLEERDQAKAAKREALKAKRAAKRGPNDPATLAEERKAQSEGEIKQSVRDIYRLLASELHPDRESDPAERVRKTELMKRINLAYKSNDLLTLLTLQIEVEQISASSLGQLGEARLAHYLQVLRVQVKTLDKELKEVISRAACMLMPERWELIKDPADLASLLAKRISETHSSIQSCDQEAASLADPARRNALIDEIRDTQRMNDRY